jgi:serine/threonine protein kinase
MESCSRDDLFAYVASKLTVFNESLCRYIFSQILSAVHYLHTNCSMAHLDIKLENVVLDSFYHPKLIDFAYSEETSTEIKSFRGTENYMAPEIYRCREELLSR